MVRKKSNQNNPEQKTRNGLNNQDTEFGQENNEVKLSKKKYEQSGGQKVKSKFHPEPEQSR
ncbi:hypothetical protein ACUXCC_004343 [Cytobacillus horneckiae]|uniref:Glycogen biosynthesis protein GlgD n=1 Tax=Cytobacillus horneckiae TaxID=549687 RepID=A0A2N0ZND3_9BACI|nr:glycogen biosynthesis protein GlgD [Cytobacillus horneckiae]NRG47141.1 glycogen biosynthesis protein GlgD [Bacillus sp. CRN 9]MBN6889353.1 glycogen biosynthesis protein GlgD [Cytobacillus horneckiae]MCM3179484.1 glycogen biosynthesis protein GlgD [Cytobacillus horneckiae]MEC1154910.1 glycogen biosynthesis protein GlgD [Cytobacillus horneckiae]MED2936184.1 glycogen biosynthesis protein GlgD [Cytobacillus horneckiae]